VSHAIRRLTLPSSGRFPAFGLQAPLMSNVRRRMNSSAPSRTQLLLVGFGFSLVVVAAILFIRSKSTVRLSIEDKVNVSSLANRICKSASLSSCPIEWVAHGKGAAMLVGQSGKPVASPEQVRVALPPPQWAESPGPDWSFQNGKYSVSVSPSSGAILVAPL
jgi:hypothetical protein